MKKGLIAFICGLLFSGLISLVIFNIQKGNNHLTNQLFYLQTGVYKTKENAISMQLTLSDLGIEGYVYENDQMYYVICGISENEKDLKELKNKLSDKQIAYVCKDVSIEGKSSDITQQLLEVLSS